MSLKLYMTEMSPPSRGAMLTAAALGVKLEYVNINFLQKEHLKPEYMEINPQHTVPTLQEGDFILWDSHAIAVYLATIYGSQDEKSSILPKDPKTRALVDQRLFFDAELFLAMKKAVMPLWANTSNSICPSAMKEIEEAYRISELFLQKTKWIACDQMTVADLSLIATVSTVSQMLPIDSNRFPKLTDWVQRLERLPYYEEVNGRGARALGEVVKSKLKP